MVPGPPRWLTRPLAALEINRAVAYAVSTRASQFLAGPITMLLIATHFTSEIQGYFYTFSSLMAVQALLELGLHSVATSVASHEWSKLALTANGEIVGEPTALRRLNSLTRSLTRWYAAIAVLFVMATIPAGLWYFGHRDPAGIGWSGPWMLLVALNGILLWMSSFAAILEGCDQVHSVHRCRFTQALSGNVGVWVAILANFGLWTLVVSAAIRVFWEAVLVFYQYARFFRSLLLSGVTTAFRWREEVWPLQWRIGIRSALGYLAFQLFTPVMFHYHGATEAGRMGMTWNIFNALDGAAFSWIHTRFPQFGVLVARRESSQLHDLFYRVTTISLAVLVVGCAVVVGAIAALQFLPSGLSQSIAERLLGWETAAVFTLGLVVNHLTKSMGMYVRAHKKDPFLIPGSVSSLAIAFCVWRFGSWYGPMGAAIAFSGVVTAFNLPCWIWIWRRQYQKWQSPEA